MRQRHNLSITTIAALQERRNGSLRKLAHELGFDMEFASTLSAILHNKPGYSSLETENQLRLALGLEAIGLAQVAVCPIHGEPHLADCHGAEVVAVVALAPGESVRKPGKPRTRQRYHRPCMDDATYAEWLAFRATRKVNHE